MLNIIVKKRYIIFFFAIVLITCLFIGMTSRVNGGSISKCQLNFHAGNPCTITNADGEMLKYDGKETFTGDMITFSEKLSGANGDWTIFVEDSNSFTFDTSYKGNVMFDVLGPTVSGNIDAVNSSQITVSKEGISVKGVNCNYNIDAYLKNNKLSVDISGTTSGNVILKDEKNGAVLSGASGKISAVLDDYKDTKTSIAKGRIYLFGGDTVLTKTGTVLRSSSGVKLNDKKKSKPVLLYLRPANNGRNMFLTWTKVKKARSYDIYQYDYQTGKYKKVAVRKGNSLNYYNIPNAVSSMKYRYAVRASRHSSGKRGFIGKRSYAVWAVAGSNEKGNAAKVTTNKTYISKRHGKTVKLTAAVTAASGKTLLSSKVRWYSSDKKIARVNKNTGKVKLIKKGRCRIWAKAHNGRNSKSVKVIVK